MGVSLEQYRARIGSYQQPAQCKMSKEKEQMVQLKKVDHDLAWKYTQVALVVLYISLCYWVLILNAFERGENPELSPVGTPDYMQEGVKSLPKQYHGVTANQLDPFSVYEIRESRIGNSSVAEWSDDNLWRHATVTRTCNLLCSGDVEENPGPMNHRAQEKKDEDSPPVPRKLGNTMMLPTRPSNIMRQVQDWTSGLAIEVSPCDQTDTMDSLERDLTEAKVEKLRGLLSETLGEEDKSDAHRRLARHVRQSGLTFRPQVPKDGNCMFHAISDQLRCTDGTRITHSGLRQQVVEYLKKNPYNGHGDHLCAYMPDQNWGAYLTSMLGDGTWGDHIVLQAMATMLGRDIRIISSVESDNYETVLSPISGSATRGPPLLLGHYAENHYASLSEMVPSKSQFTKFNMPSITSAHHGPMRLKRTSSLDANDKRSSHPSSKGKGRFSSHLASLDLAGSDTLKRESDAIPWLEEMLLRYLNKSRQLKVHLEVVKHQSDVKNDIIRSIQREVKRQNTELEKTQQIVLKYKIMLHKQREENQRKTMLIEETRDSKLANKLEECQLELRELKLHLLQLEARTKATEGSQLSQLQQQDQQVQTDEMGSEEMQVSNEEVSDEDVTQEQTQEVVVSIEPDSNLLTRKCQHRHMAKIVLLGKRMAGKTSLKKTLILGIPAAPMVSSNDQDRTPVCEIDLWETQGTDFQVFDFGGDKAYNMTHQLFLGPHALQLLVIDLSEYNSEDFYDHIGYWLETLYLHVPHEPFHLVGTHADITKEKSKDKMAEIKKAITNFMEKRLSQIEAHILAIQGMLEKAIEDPNSCPWPESLLLEALNDLEKLKSTTKDCIENEPTMHIVSSKTEQGISELRSYLASEAQRVDARQYVEDFTPESITKFCDSLKKRQQSQSNCPCWITNDETRELAKTAGLPDDAACLKAMQYLHHTGNILGYNFGPDCSQIIFHDPAGIVDILRVLFSPQSCKLRHCLQSERQKLIGQLENHSAIPKPMIKDLVQAVYGSDSTDKHVPMEQLLEVLEHHGICYPVPKSMRQDPTKQVHVPVYWFPYHLPNTAPDEIQQKLSNWNESTTEQIEILFEMKFGRSMFFDKFCANIKQFVAFSKAWSGGVFIWTAGEYRIPMVIKRKILLDDHETSISIKIWGIIAQGKKSVRKAMWEAIVPLICELEYMMFKRPGLPFQLYVACQCAKCSCDEQNPYKFDFHWRAEFLDEYCDGIVHCPASFGEEVPLDLVVPPEDISIACCPPGRGKGLKHLTSASCILQCLPGEVTSKAVTQKQLDILSSKLGNKWQSLAIQLGLLQADIENFIDSYPHDVQRQKFQMLMAWKSKNGSRSKSKWYHWKSDKSITIC